MRIHRLLFIFLLFFVHSIEVSGVGGGLPPIPPPEEGPEIFIPSSQGILFELRPAIIAAITSNSSQDIDVSSIRMEIDGQAVSHTSVPETNGPSVEISFVPDYDLAFGGHNLYIYAAYVNGVSSEVSRGFIIAELSAPVITQNNPGGVVSNNGLRISAKVSSSPYTKINNSSIEMRIDGALVPVLTVPSVNASEIEVFYSPDGDLSEDGHIVELRVEDTQGMSAEKGWDFTIVAHISLMQTVVKLMRAVNERQMAVGSVQTEFYNLTTGESLGSPDGGKNVPALDVLDGVPYDVGYAWGIIRQVNGLIDFAIESPFPLGDRWYINPASWNGWSSKEAFFEDAVGRSDWSRPVSLIEIAKVLEKLDWLEAKSSYAPVEDKRAYTGHATLPWETVRQWAIDGYSGGGWRLIAPGVFGLCGHVVTGTGKMDPGGTGKMVYFAQIESFRFKAYFNLPEMSFEDANAGFTSGDVNMTEFSGSLICKETGDIYAPVSAGNIIMPLKGLKSGSSNYELSFEPTAYPLNLQEPPPDYWKGFKVYNIKLYFKPAFSYPGKISFDNGDKEEGLGRPVDPNASVGKDPINLVNGNLWSTTQDIANLSGAGMPLKFSRTYNSLEDYQGPLGRNRTHNYNVRLVWNPDNSVTLVQEDGRRLTFTDEDEGTYISPKGEYSTLKRNSDDTYLLTEKDKTERHFLSDGALEKIIDRNGNTHTFSYTFDKRLARAEDNFSHYLSFIYDSEGRIISVKDNAERETVYAYDSAGNLQSVTDAVGNETVYTYDEQNRLTFINPTGATSITFKYDEEGRAYETYNGDGNYKVTLQFNPDESSTIVTDSRGNSTTYQYNETGFITRITGPDSNTEQTEWGENLNRAAVTDKNGNTTRWTYDDKGNLLIRKDALDNIVEFTYDETFNQITTSKDTLGNITEYSYDEKGNLIKITDPLNNIIIYTYDSYGNLLTSTDANENTTTYEYDDYVNLAKVITPSADETQFTYDTAGNLQSVTDARGNITSYTYSNLSQPLTTVYPDETVISYFYDPEGRPISVTDQIGNARTYAYYDTTDKITQAADPEGNIVSSSYDTEGNLISITDPNGNTTAHIYDKLNRLITTTTPLGNTTNYTYDSAGNLISRIDPNGNALNYQYDTLNRLTEIKYPDGTSTLYTYDAAGRRISSTDAEGTITYTYDANNRVISVQGPWEGESISYTYDPAGNRLTMTDYDGGVTQYEYDNENRLVRLTDPDNERVRYEYNEVSNLKKVRYPNNTFTKYRYDNLNRLEKLTNKAGGKLISSYSYEYDPAGRKTEVMLDNRDKITYTYDKASRLTEERRIRDSKRDEEIIRYIYDNAGNRIEKDLKGSHRTKRRKKTLYTYDQENRLVSSTEKKKSKEKAVNYTYDANGNRIEKTEKLRESHYEYDYLNRLKKVSYEKIEEEEGEEDELKEITYTYDAAGRRISAAEDGKTSEYLYDGLNVIAERGKKSSIRYTRKPGTPGGIGSIIKESSHSKGAHKKEKKKGRKKSAKRLYYHYDGQGSITDQTDKHGKVKSSYTYDAFGKFSPRRIREGKQGKHKGARNKYLFSTKEYDRNTRLYYFGARYYDPQIGRFLTKDPLGMIDGPNVYLYVSNNPVNLVDPWGLATGIWKWGAKKKAKELLNKEMPQNVPGIPGKNRKDSIGIISEEFANEITNREAKEASRGNLNILWNVLDRLKNKYPQWPWGKWEGIFEKEKKNKK